MTHISVYTNRYRNLGGIKWVRILICCKSKLNNKTFKRVCVILFLQVDKLLHSYDSFAWFCINMLRRDWKWSSVCATRRCKHFFLLCWVQFVQKVPEIGTERFLRINWRNLPESLKVILRTPDQSWFKQLLTSQTWLCLLIEGVFFDNLSQMEKITSVVISWNTQIITTSIAKMPNFVYRYI